jgi:hypothetical protein
MKKGNKMFQCGPEATLFVDPLTKLKIAGNQKVEVTPEQMKTEKFRLAKKNNHIEEVDEDDEDEQEDVNTDSAEVTSFKALRVEEMRTRLLDEYEFDEAETAEIAQLKKADLVKKYTDLETKV